MSRKVTSGDTSKRIKSLENKIHRYGEVIDELKREEKALRSLIRYSSLGIVTVDENLSVTSCNSVFEKLFQYKKSEIVGRNLDEVIARDQSIKKAKKYSSMTLKGKPTSGVEIRYRKDGKPVPVEFFAVPAIVDGKVVGAYGLYQDISDRVKMEEKLIESEARYRHLVELSPLAIAVYDEHKLYFANTAALKLFEAESEGDFSGKVLTDFIHSDSLTLVRDRISRFLRGERLPNAFVKLLTLKGNVIEVGAYSSSISFMGKKAILSVFLDVTEKRKAEAKLEEEEKRYRKLYEKSKRQEELYLSLLNSSADAIVVYNLRGEVQYVSPSFTKTFGWTFEEVKGKQIPFVPESEREATMAGITDLMENGAPVRGFETRRLTRDGRILNISISASRYNDYDGNPAGMLVFLRDITKRVEAEKRIHESEKRFRDLFDSVSDLVFTMDLKGRFLSANKAVFDILGYTSDEFVGRTPKDFMKPELRDLFDKEYMVEFKKKGYHHGLSAYLAKDGRKIYIEHRSTLVRPERGEPYVSGIARDVTERILSERRINKLREEMLQAQKMDAIGRLAGGIAHDFNNLLMGIQGNISLLKMQSDPEYTGYERLKSIEEYVQRGSELTRQLLGFARGGRYEATPTDLNRLIGMETKLFGRTKKEVEIHKKLQDDLWPVEVDRGQIGQVFLNLFVNAWQAMPKGGYLYLQTENVVLKKIDADILSLSPGRYVKITVSDTGIGMDEETQKRIFEPFFTTKERERGTGLGLASVYGIIKNHGGAIGVESQLGKGTTFTLYIPATDKEVWKAKPEAQGEIVTGKGRILLIDDESKILEVGEQILKVLGYDVIVANNGKKAIDIFRKERGAFDLTILDMIMPVMGGRDVFDALKKINPSAKVLLASGYSINGEASEIMARGCNGFIQKPFSMEKLSKKIHEVLSEG